MATTVPISCPDCAGVLSVVVRGARYEDYICQVGHAYAPADLLTAKEQQVERALWSALVLLQHVDLIVGHLGGQPRSAPTEAPVALDQRQQQARAHMRALRDIIEQTRTFPVS